MTTDFNRTYHVNAQGGLFAVDTWTTPGGEHRESRVSAEDISEEDYLNDRAEIDLAYLDRENELAEEERTRRHRRGRGR